MSLPKTVLKAKQPLRFAPLIFCLTAALFFSRCSNNENTDSAAASTTAENKTEAAAAPPPPGSSLNIASLFLEADTFVKLDDKNGFNKLVFQMYHAKDSNSLRAVVFPAKNNNIEFDESAMKILQWRKDSINIEGMDIFLGDQQTKKRQGGDEFKDFVKEIEDNNADPAKPKITFVIFDPMMDPANPRRFIYKMYGVTNTSPKDAGIMALTIATKTYETNPSPPAKPD